MDEEGTHPDESVPMSSLSPSDEGSRHLCVAAAAAGELSGPMRLAVAERIELLMLAGDFAKATAFGDDAREELVQLHSHHGAITPLHRSSLEADSRYFAACPHARLTCSNQRTNWVAVGSSLTNEQGNRDVTATAMLCLLRG